MNVKRLEIIRADPNNAYVARYDDNFILRTVTDIMPYWQALQYMRENQETASVYKIARILNRRNAKRRLVHRILCEDKNKAIQIFNKYCEDEKTDCRLQLLSGDWQLIAQKDLNGLIKII